MAQELEAASYPSPSIILHAVLNRVYANAGHVSKRTAPSEAPMRRRSYLEPLVLLYLVLALDHGRPQQRREPYGMR